MNACYHKKKHFFGTHYCILKMCLKCFKTFFGMKSINKKIKNPNMIELSIFQHEQSQPESINISTCCSLIKDLILLYDKKMG